LRGLADPLRLVRDRFPRAAQHPIAEGLRSYFAAPD
jgi:hypothetical protein